MNNPESLGEVTFAWWNVNDFYHFDATHVSRDTRSRWPQSLGAYEEKCARVDRALNALFLSVGVPSILALCEITRSAAEELRARILPTYRVISLDSLKGHPSLQVAILVAPDTERARFEEQQPIVVADTPRGTRAMCVLDVITAGARTRCVVCHWPPKFTEESAKIRWRLADYLARYCYSFLKANSVDKRSLLILGDLNEEPPAETLAVLNAHRHRGRAQSASHASDKDVARVHLYNTSWRLLGEKHPHPVSESGALAMSNAAGTYYRSTHYAWYHLDHLIVSGGLLQTSVPYLRESEVAVISLPEFLTDGLPKKFAKKDEMFTGVSDHLPIFARIHI